MTVDEFVAKYNGKKIDEDGYYGTQCWDVAARYGREVVGCPSMPTGSGGAEGLYRLAKDPILKYFDKVANDKNNPNQLPPKGALIVWNGSFSAPWGHVALCISADKSGVTVLEQNGGNDPNGDGIADGNAYIIKRTWHPAIDGWLVPKAGGSDMSKTDINIARILAFSILGRVDANNNALEHKSDPDLNAFHVGAETNQKIWDFFNSEEGRAWRDGRLPRLLNSEAEAGTLGKQLADANTAINTLQNQINELGKRPTQEQLDALAKTAKDANDKAMAAQAELEKLQVEKAEAEKTGNAFLQWLGGILSKLKPGGN